MRRLWKWLGLGAGAIVAFCAAALGYFYIASQAIILRHYPLPVSSARASKDPQAVARGSHLASVYGCADCHARTLQGAFIADFGVSSRNLTRLASSFSDADFERAVRKGLRPGGTSVAEFMPSDAFQYMADGDMADIIAYIRSLKPGGEDIPFPAYDFKARFSLLKGESHMDQFWFAQQKPALNLGVRYSRGRQLAMTACGECHMTALTGAPDFLPPPRAPDLSLVASYTREDFVRLMRAGKAAGGRELPLMSSTARLRFSRFSDSQVNAVYDYLAARGRNLAGAGG
jgi:cytochrome c553